MNTKQSIKQRDNSEAAELARGLNSRERQARILLDAAPEVFDQAELCLNGVYKRIDRSRFRKLIKNTRLIVESYKDKAAEEGLLLEGYANDSEGVENGGVIKNSAYLVLDPVKRLEEVCRDYSERLRERQRDISKLYPIFRRVKDFFKGLFGRIRAKSRDDDQPGYEQKLIESGLGKRVENVKNLAREVDIAMRTPNYRKDSYLFSPVKVESLAGKVEESMIAYDKDKSASYLVKMLNETPYYDTKLVLQKIRERNPELISGIKDEREARGLVDYALCNMNERLTSYRNELASEDMRQEMVREYALNKKSNLDEIAKRISEKYRINVSCSTIRRYARIELGDDADRKNAGERYRKRCGEVSYS